MMDLKTKGTQAKFAQLVGITQPAVSGLIARGVLAKGDSLENWLLAYCGNLRETAAGRSQSGESELNLNDEKARLAAAQADLAEMDVAVRRGELAPVAILEAVLARAGGKIAAMLDTIPVMLKQRLPSLTEAEVGLARREIARVRNAAASMSLEDAEADDEEEGG